MDKFLGKYFLNRYIVLSGEKSSYLGTNGNVYVLALQPNGKIVVGGSFSTLAGQNRYYIGQLNADGTQDSTFP